jgi:hypothetical protein
MQLIPEMMLATAVLALAVPTAAIRQTDRDAPQAVEMAATVRVSNSLATPATIHVNGRETFTGIKPGETSDWAQITDSTATFVLTVPGEEGEKARVSEKLIENGRYTVTATMVEGTPTLTVRPEPAEGETEG